MRAKGTARITWVAMAAYQYAAQTGKGENKIAALQAWI